MSAQSRKNLPEAVNAALARTKGPVSKFLARHYRHFNAAALLDAAKAYDAHLKAGGKMLEMCIRDRSYFTSAHCLL